MVQIGATKLWRSVRAVALATCVCACGVSYDASQDQGVIGNAGNGKPDTTTPGTNTGTTPATHGGNATNTGGNEVFATGPNAVFTAAGVQATPASAAVEALIAAKFFDDTTVAQTPMGKRFLGILGTPVSAQQLALLQNAAFQSPLPVAARASTGYARWPIQFYTASSPNIAEFVGGGSDYTPAATLFGIAWQNPNFARGLVKQQDANTFAVRLYDPNGEPVSVVVDNMLPTPTASPNAFTYLMGGATDTPTRVPQANWASIVDKAIMKYCFVYGLGDPQGATYGSSGFIGSETVAAILTGNGSSIAFAPGALDANTLQLVVTRAMASGAMVIGGWAQSSNDLAGWQVQPLQAYAVGAPGSAVSTTVLQYRSPTDAVTNVNGVTLYDRVGHRGVLNLAPDDPLLALLELRIMAPGAAAGGKNTAMFDTTALGGHATGQ